MKINFGTTAKTETDKAMEVLQKWSGPIFEQTAKKGIGSTVKSSEHDPYKTAMLLKDIPSSGEALMGGAMGALNGFLAGGSMAVATGGNKELSQAAGAILGGFAGASSYGSSREAGQNTGLGLNRIAEQAAGWEQMTKQKAAEDAIASMGQRFAVLNNPRTPEEAIKYAAEKDALVAQTAQRLYSAGIAPDKAIIVAENIASIHDPSGKYSPIGMRANAAMMKYNASAQAPADKAELAMTMRQLVMEKRVADGELPFDMGVAVRQGAKAGVGAVTMAPKLPAPTIQTQQSYAAQTTAQGVPAYLAPNPTVTPTIKPGGSVVQGKDGFTTSIVPQFGPNLAPNVLAPETVNKIEGLAGPQIGDIYEQSSVKIAQNLEAIRAIGSSNEKVGNLIDNIDGATKAIDGMIEVVVNHQMPSGTAEMWGSEIYQEGLSPGMASAAGGAAGAALGVYIGAHTGPGAPVAIPLASKGLAAAGAGVGAMVGKGFAGIGKGKGPFLEASDKKALTDIEGLKKVAVDTLSKSGDPNSQVTDAERESWKPLFPSPARTPIENLTGLIKLKELLADKAEIAHKAVTMSEKGNIKKLLQEQSIRNANEMQIYKQKKAYDEAYKNREKTYGINFFNN